MFNSIKTILSQGDSIPGCGRNRESATPNNGHSRGCRKVLITIM